MPTTQGDCGNTDGVGGRGDHLRRLHCRQLQPCERDLSDLDLRRRQVLDATLPRPGMTVELPCPLCPGNKKLAVERLMVPDPRYAWSYVRGSTASTEPGTTLEFRFGSRPRAVRRQCDADALRVRSAQGGTASPCGLHRSINLRLSTMRQCRGAACATATPVAGVGSRLIP